MDKFRDRYEAGNILASYLKDFAHKSNVIVLASPRGGVPVADETETALSLPLDIYIARKLGVPNHEEYAMGTIALGGTVFFNKSVMNELNMEQGGSN